MAEELIDKIIDQGKKIRDFNFENVQKEIDMIKGVKSALSNEPAVNLKPSDIVGMISNPVGTGLELLAGQLLPRLKDRRATQPKPDTKLDEIYAKVEKARFICTCPDVDDILYDIQELILKGKSQP